MMAAEDRMTTITIELPDDQAQRLQDEARRRRVSLEELVAASALASLEEAGAGADRTMSREAFDKALAYVLDKNEELYRRLA
jgi:hypothetical protein